MTQTIAGPSGRSGHDESANPREFGRESDRAPKMLPVRK